MGKLRQQSTRDPSKIFLKFRHKHEKLGALIKISHYLLLYAMIVIINHSRSKHYYMKSNNTL